MKRRKITKQMLNSFENYLTEDEKSDATKEKYMRDIRFLQNLHKTAK